MSDTIADMLTIVRNANKALLPTVEIPHSKTKESIAHILKKRRLHHRGVLRRG